MAYNTDNLNLFCYDTVFDIDEIFSVEQALNDNWVILDNAYGNLTNLIPTKTSQLTNDSGFLTQHQSLADYVKKTDANTVSGNTTFTGVTKVPSSATVGTAVSTAAISKAANGYVKFGNGIIIEWGSVSLTGGTAKTITLPTAFSSTNYKVASGIDTTNQSGNEQNWIQISSIKAGSFALKRCDTGTNHWIAIGY